MIADIEFVIKKSEALLSMKTIGHEDYVSYQHEVELLMVDMISNKSYTSLNNTMESILSRNLDNPNRTFITKWIFSLFNFRAARDFNAPFLMRHSLTDNYKKYIFWTKFSLEGMIHRIGIARRATSV